MAKPFFLFISLALVLFPGSLARQEFQYQNECQLNIINSLEPDNRVECEAGVIESWNPNRDQFQCPGVAIVRRIIQSKGLLLPHYSNAPQLIYIVRGRGLTGALFPGCPETFQDSQLGSQQQGQGGRRFQDQHQRIRRFSEGDIIALPAGTAHWCYNDGSNPVEAITFLHLDNQQNQLDNTFPRHFFLAGNPHEEFRQQQREHGQQGRPGQQQGSPNYKNLFNEMDIRLLAEAFNVDKQVARKLQSEGDSRGNIVKVHEGLRVVEPPSGIQEERQQGEREGYAGPGGRNGFEETLCSMRIKENIGNPTTADMYNPDAGYISKVSCYNLPVLHYLGLSAEKGTLYNGAIQVPHYFQNAHNIIYAIRGEAWVQITGENGNQVFNGTLREGQVLTLPQNYVKVKRAESDKFEWVSFMTNSNPVMTPLGGGFSAIRALPVEVVANAYQVSVEEARRIKFGAQETILRNPRSGSGGRYDA